MLAAIGYVFGALGLLELLFTRDGGRGHMVVQRGAHAPKGAAHLKHAKPAHTKHAKPHATHALPHHKVPKGAAVAVHAVPANAGRSAQLVTGKRYKATLALSGIESLATNEMVLAKIQAAVGPWKSPSVTGDGASREAVGTYAGSSRSVTLPEEVTKLEELIVAPITATPVAQKPAPKPAAPKPMAPTRIASAQPPAPAVHEAPKPTQTESGDPNALALDAYIRSGGRSRAKIADLQWPLGLDADGIPGPSTHDAVARGLGHAPSWKPMNVFDVNGEAPGGSTAREAAERLERYHAVGGVRKDRIGAYQDVLGVPTTSSSRGIIGPKTRAAASSALGRPAAL